MNVVADTSIILAVLTSEPERAGILKATKGADLLAPASVHWEVGNALSAMLKRGRLSFAQARVALKSYEQIPIRFVDVGLADAIELAAEHKLYAYDAYLIVCAREQRCKLLSLDHALLRVANDVGVEVLEVPPQ
jgi:predicted nucleic acid-binding protein